MPKYLVSYDLNRGETGDAYRKVINYILSYAYHAKALYSQWIIKTDKTAATIRDEMQHLVDSDDVVLITQVFPAPYWASYNLPADAVELLKN